MSHSRSLCLWLHRCEAEIRTRRRAGVALLYNLKDRSFFFVKKAITFCLLACFPYSSVSLLQPANMERLFEKLCMPSSRGPTISVDEAKKLNFNDLLSKVSSWLVFILACTALSTPNERSRPDARQCIQPAILPRSRTFVKP